MPVGNGLSGVWDVAKRSTLRVGDHRIDKDMDFLLAQSRCNLVFQLGGPGMLQTAYADHYNFAPCEM